MLAAARVHAQPANESVDLAWNAPAECPSRELVLADVAGVLRGSRGHRLPVTASVDVTRAPVAANRWSAVVRVETSDMHSEKRFDAETCQAIASAAGLIIAVAVEGGMPLSPVPPPSPGSPVASAESLALPAERGGHATLQSQLIFAAAGLVDDGMMPRPPAGGVEVALGWSARASGWRLRALVGASYFPSQSKVGERAGNGGTFWLTTTSARVCASIVLGRLDIGPCLGGEVDIMNASGSGPTTTFDPASANGIWGSALGAVVATWGLSPRVAAFMRGELVVPFAQQRFVLMPGSVLVHQPSRTSLRAAIGVELRIF